MGRTINYAESIKESEAELLKLEKASNHQLGLSQHNTITLAHLPTACPEINPAERFF